MAAKVIWQPQPGSQTLFLGCPIFEVLFEGTRGPGKTDALLMDFVQHVGQGFGAEWRGILFRRTYKELKDVIAKSKKWFKQFFPTATYNKVEKTWTFPDGEQLILSNIRVIDDYWDYHGHQYPWIAFEELTNWPDDGPYRKMMSCSRSTAPGMPRKFRATCNPYGVGHNWVKRRFRLPRARGVVIRDAVDHEGNPEPERVAIHGTLFENKILLEADPDYVMKIRASARNKAELAAWLYGSWDIVAGGMFDDVWDVKVHVLKPFDIPFSWKVDRSYDHGSSAPFSVGWWAESDGTDVVLEGGRILHTVKGDLFRIREWYGADKREANLGLRMLSTEIADGIKEREEAMIENGFVKRRIKPGPADTSIWDDNDGPSIAKKMEGRRVAWTKADKGPGSRKQGWEEMRQRLKASHGGLEGHRTAPGLFIFDTCQDFIDLIPVLPRSDKDLDDVDTHAEDHIGDETRYRVRKPKRVVKASDF